MARRWQLGALIGTCSAAAAASYLCTIHTERKKACLCSTTSYLGKQCAKEHSHHPFHLNHTSYTAKEKALRVLQRYQVHSGVPGVAAAVSIDGELVWCAGVGWSDAENLIPINAESSSFRIASISKVLTSVLAARAVEQGQLMLDAPVREYLTSEEWKEGDITTRQLLSHRAGIRSYHKEEAYDDLEYHSALSYPSVFAALEPFKHDALEFSPGTNYKYSTYGYTVVSCVLERATGRKFGVLLDELLNELGMKQSGLDRWSVICTDRVKPYQRNQKGFLINAPYVDNSVKWAGGGMRSTATDLVRLGDALLFAWQRPSPDQLSLADAPSSLLQKNTLKEFWKIYRFDQSVNGNNTVMTNGTGYGLGFQLIYGGKFPGGARNWKRRSTLISYHCGGAVGGTSMLLMVPTDWRIEDDKHLCQGQPKGVSVALLTNLQRAKTEKCAHQLANIFLDELD